MEYKLEKDIMVLKWCAYDTQFEPNKLDNRFKDWANNGITAVCMIIKDNILFSFGKVKEKYNLEMQHFYRYLQMRHFVTGIIKKIIGTKMYM